MFSAQQKITHIFPTIGSQNIKVKHPRLTKSPKGRGLRGSIYGDQHSPSQRFSFMFKTLEKDMFLYVLAYQNHICNRTVCSLDDIDAGFVQLQTTQGLRALLENTASKSDIS